jgi:hypothetical protein
MAADSLRNVLFFMVPEPRADSSAVPVGWPSSDSELGVVVRSVLCYLFAGMAWKSAQRLWREMKLEGFAMSTWYQRVGTSERVFRVAWVCAVDPDPGPRPG